MSVSKEINEEGGHKKKYTYEEKLARGVAKKKKIQLILKGLMKSGKKNVYVDPDWYDDAGKLKTNVSDKKENEYIRKHLK